MLCAVAFAVLLYDVDELMADLLALQTVADWTVWFGSWHFEVGIADPKDQRSLPTSLCVSGYTGTIVPGSGCYTPVRYSSQLL